MPAAIAALVRALAAFWRVLAPWLIKLWQGLHLDKIWLFVVYWFNSWAAQTAINTVARITIVFAGLALHAAVLLAFWTWSSGSALRELFSANPLAGASASALYLASHAFPLKFMFGTAVSFILWRLSFIKLAIVFSRAVKLLTGY